VFQAISTGQTITALHRLASAGEAVVGNLILPDSQGLAPTAQPQFDGLAIWLAGISGRILTRDWNPWLPGDCPPKSVITSLAGFTGARSPHAHGGHTAIPAAYKYAPAVPTHTRGLFDAP
jgi:hypothetical protein